LAAAPLLLLLLLLAAVLPPASSLHHAASGARAQAREEGAEASSAKFGSVSSLKGCRGALRRARATLAQCLEASEAQPTCNCICPTCKPPKAVDYAALPPCTTPAPGGGLEYTTSLIPLPALSTLPPLDNNVMQKQYSLKLKLLQCRGAHREVQLQLHLKGCSDAAAALTDEEEEAASQQQQQQRLRRRIVPAECQCHCPPCDQEWPAAPTCRPPGMVLTSPAQPVSSTTLAMIWAPTTTFHLPPLCSLGWGTWIGLARRC